MVKNRVYKDYISILQGVDMLTNETELQPLVNGEAFEKANTPKTIEPEVEKQGQAIEQLTKIVSDSNLLSDGSYSGEDSLNKILASEKLLTKVKEDLNNVVDAVAKNPSLITQFAEQWGKLPSWQKYSGAIVGVPFLIVGFSTLAIVPILLGGTALAIYTAGGLILEDHYQRTIDITESLKKGILSLADVLGLVIKALDKIRRELAVEVEKFRAENIRLTNNIEALGMQIDSLSQQTTLFIQTEKILREDVTKLQNTVELLKDTSDVQRESLDKALSELSLVKKAYEKSQDQLTEKVVELTTLKIEMGREVEKAKKVALTLKGTVDTLSGTIIEDEKHKKEFQQRLENFLSDKEKSFCEVTDKICEAERQLVIVKEELKRSNERYQLLLDKQEHQISRLEKLDKQERGVYFKLPDNVNQLLDKQGLFSSCAQQNNLVVVGGETKLLM